MRPSMFKRMVAIGAYRSTEGANTQPTPDANVVDEGIAAIQGTEALPSRPEDKPYTIWESQCEIELDEFLPSGSPLKGKGVAVPFLVSINKDTEEVVAIRRDFDKDDPFAHRLQMYVRYPYIPGPGAYGTGLLNILGNSSAAMTGAWLLALDCGMFANFPGGLIAKAGGKQDNYNLRPQPGEFVVVETGGMAIKDAVGQLPYHDVTPGLLGLIDKIVEQSKALSQAAEIPAGEGLKDIPVGTMLAQIEQATKVIAAVHKGMHTAQSQELQLLAEGFKRDPEDFYRDNKDDKDYWDDQKLLKALDEKSIKPVSDPNIPSHIHRLAKVLALIQLKQQFPQLRDDRILRRALSVLHEDYDDLVDPNYAPQAAMDPEAQAKSKMADAKMVDAQGKLQKNAADRDSEQLKTATKMAEIASEERQRELDVTKEQIIHDMDDEKLQVAEHRNHIMEVNKLQLDAKQQVHDRTMDIAKHSLETQKVGLAAKDSEHQHGKDLAAHALNQQQAAHDAALDVHQALNPPKPAAPKASKPKK